ncbi:MAG: hypothetical protein JRM91_01225 [Nitrososphaerota archaeon]|nr:hypothetical protein [Nitrososphaerota archaeon]
MAEAIFNRRGTPHRASSAGVAARYAGIEGRRLVEVRPEVVMTRDVGIDVSDAVSKRLTEEMVRRADLIVYLGETEHVPSYLKKCRTLLPYGVQDHVSMTHAEHAETTERVQEVVSDVIGKFERL